ncbi:MAG: hypothetical protein IPN66_08720 [Candidatus Competibacteraceae bacterium]|nr:hypothetical protein [Candidatus Competibacteraceae bacterium]
MKSITTWSIIAVVASSIAACKPSDNALSANTSQATQPAAQQPTISTPLKNKPVCRRHPSNRMPKTSNALMTTKPKMNSRKYWVDLKSASGKKYPLLFMRNPVISFM